MLNKLSSEEPYGEEQEQIRPARALATAGPPRLNGGLCARCRTLNLSAKFKTPRQTLPAQGRSLRSLGLEEFMKSGQCSMCSLLVAHAQYLHLRHRETGALTWQGGPHHLRAFSSLKLLNLRATPRRKKQMPSVVLAVVAGPPQPSLYADEFSDFLKAGFIVPSNDEKVEKFEESQICKYEGRVVDLQNVNCAEIRRWLTVCQQQHGEACNLRVRSFDFNAKVLDCYDLKLEPMTEKTEYFALSYVWGQPAETKPTNGDSGDRLLSHIKSKTIADAITVVKRLGKRCLWVDKICIPREDEFQRNLQIQNMHHIYENAVATIVATSGVDSEAGLPGVSSVSRSEQPLATVDGQTFVSTLPHLEHFLGKSKWASRGWTYQEALLSRRCLFFTEAQVYFRCRSSAECESVRKSALLSLWEQERNLETSSGNFLNPALFKSGHELKPTVDPSSQPEFYGHLTEYTARALSKGSDSLNALRGILERCPCYSYWGIPIVPPERLFGTVPDSRSVNALDSDLDSAAVDQGFAQGLAWKQLRDVEFGSNVDLNLQNSSQQVRIPGFPTWSWTSVKGRIECPVSWKGQTQEHMDKQIEILRTVFESGKLRSAPSIWSYNKLERLVPFRQLRAESMVSRIIPEESRVIYLRGEVAKVRLRFDEDTNFRAVSPTASPPDPEFLMRMTEAAPVSIDVALDDRMKARLLAQDLDAVLLWRMDVDPGTSRSPSTQSCWLLLEQDGINFRRLGLIESRWGYLEEVETRERTVRLE